MNYNSVDEPKEFIAGTTFFHNKKYKYSLFFNEVDNRFYLNENEISKIIDKINWDLNRLEKSYLNTWNIGEKIHKEYAKKIISYDEYVEKINAEFDKFEEVNELSFGVGCDKLISLIIKELEK